MATALKITPTKAPDMEKFRLRRFVEKLIDMGEVEVHDEPIDLAALSPIIEGTQKAVLFRKAGPERSELVANVMGKRSRMAAAFGVSEEELPHEFQRRIENPQPVIEVSSSEAPVHQMKLTGDRIDLTKLPFHPQHEYDGSVYLTSGLDYVIEPETGLTNVGARRLSLRNKTECGTNVTARSHLREIYLRCAKRGERLPITFACGSHPLDFMAAGMRIRQDEVALVGTLRGEPVPLVKSLTNDIRVPADAEMIIEGYLHEFGYSEPEGPYGEYMGYYGPMHLDPIFHVTAITMRKDVLHQSLLHGSGWVLGHCESANLSAVRVEAEAFHALKSAGLDVRATHMPRFAGEGQHIRVAIKQTGPGQAKRAIYAIMAAMPMVKHVWVVDDDVNVRSDDAMDWAMGTRFQANKDIIVLEGMPGMQMDPSLEGQAFGAKAGFDMTKRPGKPWAVQNLVTEAKVFSGQARYQTVQKALEAEPHFFTHLMEAVGSRDGREVAVALDELRLQGKLGRDSDGRYHMVDGKPGHTVHVGPEGHDPNML